eukprot:TRINITY_DN19880_c0_g1_i1.p1 TRINITY_DN19880_c0_g1~~TRINITY_DN19880_c0_g1_i1.p1  ORF type:complete len:264 (+),score=45.65 TRINITY_DN19880_c0_g1_i1:61-792(+)
MCIRDRPLILAKIKDPQMLKRWTLPFEPTEHNPGFFLNWINSNRPEHPSIYDCLICFFEKGKIQDGSFTCPKCGEATTHERKFSITRLPNTLIIGVKRFNIDPRNFSKITASMDFPLDNLDLTPFITPSARYDQRDPLYELIGVIEHKGSFESQEFASITKNEKYNTWFSFQDFDVNHMDAKSVPKAQPYILLYKRKMFEQLRERHNIASQVKLMQRNMISHNEESTILVPNFWFEKLSLIHI